MIHLLAIALAAMPAPDAAAPVGPAEAILLADRHHGLPVVGTYRMVVAAAGRHAGTVFLNSAADYRAPDDLTFDLLGSAAWALARQLGAPPEAALLGRTVTVRGAVEVVPIAEVGLGGVRRVVRVQHRVRVFKADQLTVQ